MSDKIHTREFCISDYDAALQLWQRVEGLEIAEGDEREDIAQFLARNVGMSRVAVDGSAIDLAPGTKIYLLKESGRVTAILTATDYPRAGSQWIEMDNNWSLQNLLIALFGGPMPGAPWAEYRFEKQASLRLQV